MLCAGKSAAVAARFAGSLSSVGIHSHFVNAAEWMHGDLGTSSIHPATRLNLSHNTHTSLLSSLVPFLTRWVIALLWYHCDGAGKAEAGRDLVVFLSHGGGTVECVEAARHLAGRGVATLAITSRPGCSLA